MSSMPADEPASEPASVADATVSPATAAPSPTPAETGARLAELFPALFAGPAQPLKLRIQADIQARAPGVFSKQVLSAFLRRHTTTTPYLLATSKATHRFDLDGQPAGELSDEHRQVAVQELSRRRAIRDARRQAEQQGRRTRIALLRDFERTTLTEANFCALKGIDLTQWPALLAQARQEAQEEAQRPAQPHHRRQHHDARQAPRQPDTRSDARRSGPRRP